MHPETSHSELAAKVTRLQRQNRWLMLGLALVGGFVLFVAAAPQSADTITAQRFVLEDSSGVEKGSWHVGEDGNPGLRVGQEDGQWSILGKGGLSILRPAESGTQGMQLTILSPTGLQFQNIESGMSLKLIAVSENVLGEIGPRIELSTGDHGQVTIGRVRLETERTGSVEVRPASSIVLFDDDGKVIWKAPR